MTAAAYPIYIGALLIVATAVAVCAIAGAAMGDVVMLIAAVFVEAGRADLSEEER